MSIKYFYVFPYCFYVFFNDTDCLVPVVTVQLGEPVTLSCAFSERLQGTWLHWYKQSAGGTLKFIVMQQKTIDPKYDPNAPASRMKATIDDKLGNLTIMETVLQDEGMYHCARMDWTESIWSGTYFEKEATFSKNITRTYSNPVSDPARPADSENLQCSVVSESEDKACSGELNVFWFRTGSEQSHPEIIYTNDKELHICENTLTSNAQKKCSYSFSKNFNSSDTLYSATYYCAVATCGEILFGNGTSLNKGYCYRRQHHHCLPSRHCPLKKTFCSNRNFSSCSVEEKFSSLETALHFRIFFGTRAKKKSNCQKIN
uniref:Ig-like domain-containing protein n=1 Tax=Xiphophorus couchianus TaxID=32473 RepID=A0A3B5KVM4_9TELE